MNKHKKGSRFILLAAVLLVLGMLLGACGTDKPTGGVVQTKAGVVSGGTSTAGQQTCMTCHNDVTQKWLGTRHGNVNNDPPADFFGATAFGCPKCHDALNVYSVISASPLVVAITATFNTLGRPVTGCESCHGLGNLHVDAGGVGPIGFTAYSAGVISGSVSSLAVSGQFRTCTACHALLNPDDPVGSAPTTTTGHTAPFNTADEIITDTHFANLKTFFSSTSPLAGYAMDYSSDKVCTDCHNPHGVVNINQEWAKSAHGDKGPAQGYFTNAWARSNWSCNGTSNAGGCGTTTISDNRRCQRCHTATGFAAFANKLQAGDSGGALDLIVGTTSAVTYTSAGWKPEMLRCNGCHTDNRGTLRKPGALTANYDFFSTTTATTGVVTPKYFSRVSAQYEDAGNSNICILCHSGRESGETLKGLNDPARLSDSGFDVISGSTITFFNFSNNSLVSGHDLTAAGTLFRSTGYEFSDRSYENISTYRHDQIGSSAAPNTGTSGPCVGCHMSRPNGNGNHIFLPVTRSTTTIGEIVNIASQVCIYCHTVSGAGGLEALMNERKAELAESLEAAIYVLDKRGFGIRSGTPYPIRVSTGPTGSGGTVNVVTGNTTVNGVGTQWVTAPSGTVITAGTDKDYFKTDNDGTYYQITAATDNTLTLATAYAGSSLNGQNYTIIRSGRTNSSKNWLTQAGTGVTVATSTDTDTTGNTTGKNNMGAVFNVALLEGDPGAYVHNRIYTKRLLYDAIDWADDNSLNFSTGTTLNNISAAAIFKAGAMKYLLPYGVLGIPAERP